MRKALASVIVIAIAGLLCASLLAFFNGSVLGEQVGKTQGQDHIYLIS